MRNLSQCKFERKKERKKGVVVIPLSEAFIMTVSILFDKLFETG